MTAQPANFSAFIDAARDSLAREIATVRREAQRERDTFAAEMRAVRAEWEARLAAVSEVERRMADRIASIKDGEPGRDGKDGSEGVPGRDGVDGTDGRDGADGRDGTSVTIDDVLPAIEARIAELVSAIPIPQNGRDGVDGKDGRDGVGVSVEEVMPAIETRIAELVSELPTPKDGRDGRDGTDGAAGRDGTDGKSVTIDDLVPVVAEAVQRAVTALPMPENGKDGADGRDGKDADPEAIRAMVDEAVAALPPAKDGEPGAKGDKGDAGERGADGSSVTVADLEPLLREMVAAIPLPKDGEPGERGPAGPMGALPTVRAWEDRVYYEGEVCTFDGGVYQASRDTGKAPDHADWTCIVSKGRDGEDGRSPNVRGLWTAEQDYSHLDVVALNGASFIAKRDNPGECPGDGWQLMAMQGKPGKPGIKGDTGMGIRGLPGPSIKEMRVDGDGMLTLVNADGSEVSCDFYPLLSRLGG